MLDPVQRSRRAEFSSKCLFICLFVYLFWFWGQFRLNLQFSIRGNVAPQSTFGNVCRHFLGVTVRKTLLGFGGGQGYCQHPTVHRMPTAPSRPGIIQSKFYLCGVEKAVILLLFCVQLFGTPRTVASQAPLSTISQGLLKFLSIESVILSHPLLPPSPFAFYLAQQQSLFQ